MQHPGIEWRQAVFAVAAIELHSAPPKFNNLSIGRGNGEKEGPMTGDRRAVAVTAEGEPRSRPDNANDGGRHRSLPHFRAADRRALRAITKSER